MNYFKSEAFTARALELSDRHHIPGLSVAIIHHGQVASKAFGKASLEPSVACTADTLFDVASVSKSITAAAVALLVEDDENHPDIKWDTVVSKLLPDDFILPGEGYTESVTLDDIVSHRTGLAGHDLSYLSTRARKPDTPRSVTRNLRNLPVSAPLRTKYMYNNSMFTVATHLIEVATGETFADFLQSRFFQPLGMSSTFVQPSQARAAGQGARIARGYDWWQATSSLSSFENPDTPEAQGAGSIVTSANDYIKYVAAMLSPQEAGPITPSMVKALTRARTIVDPDGADCADHPHVSPALYAAGWEVHTYRGARVVRHDGGIPGFGSTHWFLPGRGFGGVVFGNPANNGGAAEVLMRELCDAALGVPAAERPDWPAIIYPAGRKTAEQHAEELAKERDEVREMLCPGIERGTVYLQSLPLDVYVGDYHNAGYHGLTVEVRTSADGKSGEEQRLFIDATDRSMGFTVVFEHVADQTKYVAHQADWLCGGDVVCAAEFVLDESGRSAVRMGLRLEEDYDGYIWFDRVRSETVDDILLDSTGA